mgnify:CR=1 FL=1
MAFASLLTIAAFVAGTPSPPKPTLDDIVVTGERAPRSISRTASSLVVITGDDLEAQAATDRVDQVLAAIPNVQLGSQGSGPTIRGQDTTGATRDLAAFLGGNRPRTTLVVDGRAVSYNEFAFGVQPLWDVRQVEIFRTPQSTTQGRNSIAGAIFVSTADPVERVEAKARLIAGAARTRQFSAIANAPLADHTSARLTVDVRDSRSSSDLSDDSRPGFNLNRDRARLVRLKIRSAPEWLDGGMVSMSGTHSETAMPQIEGLRAPFSKRRDPIASYGFFDIRSDALTAQAELPFSSALQLDSTVTAGWAKATRNAPPGFGEALNETRDQSAEVILRWTSSPTVRLVAGVSASRQALNQKIDLSAILGLGSFRDVQTSAGLFADATVDVTSAVTLSTGVRWQHDRQRRAGTLDGVRGPERLDYDGQSDFLLPRVTLSYAIAPRVVMGLLVQKASNPGGTTISVGGPLAFAPETLWTAEVFARAHSSDRKWELSANVFHTRFHDSQRSLPRLLFLSGGRVVTFYDIVNVRRARSSGVEANVDWSISPNLRLSLSGALLATRLGPAPSALLGREFQRAPHWSARSAVTWRPIETLTLSAQARGRAGYFSDDRNTPVLKIGSGWLVDARASWSHGRVEIFGYARNVFDRFQLTSLTTPTFATAEDPREIGAGLSLSY